MPSSACTWLRDPGRQDRRPPRPGDGRRRPLLRHHQGQGRPWRRTRTSPSTRSPSAAQIVVALQTVVAREIDPIQPAVVTVGAFLAGEAANVIPDTAELRGTVRSFDPEVRKQLQERIHGPDRGHRQVHAGRSRGQVQSRLPADGQQRGNDRTRSRDRQRGRRRRERLHRTAEDGRRRLLLLPRSPSGVHSSSSAPATPTRVSSGATTIPASTSTKKAWATAWRPWSARSCATWPTNS